MEQYKPLSLRRNFSWTFIGNVVYAACQWGMVVVLAKLGSPEMVGQFTLGLAVTAPVIMFTNLQLRAVQATDAKKQYLFSDYLTLRLMGTGLALLVIILITFFVGYHWQTSLVIFLVGLAKAIESISDVFYGLIQQHERMDRIAVSLIIKGILSLLLLTIGVYISASVVWGAIGLVVAWVIVLVGYDFRSGALMLNNSIQKLESEELIEPNQVVLRLRWHLVTLRKLVSVALPLGFVMMLVSLNTNIPRYFMERYLGERELGIFAAISYLMVAGNMVVSALGDSASPRLAKYYAMGNRKAFRLLLLKLIGIAALLGGMGILATLLFGRQILIFLYSPDYGVHTDLFVQLMIGAAIIYIASFLGYGITAARYFRIQVPMFASISTILVVSCFWLIPTNGFQGAAIAQIIAGIAQVIITSGVIIHSLNKLQKSVLPII